MAQICPVCNSPDTQTELIGIFCLNCGRRSTYQQVEEAHPAGGPGVAGSGEG